MSEDEKFKEYCEKQGFIPTKYQEKLVRFILSDEEYGYMYSASALGKTTIVKHLHDFLEKEAKHEH